MAENKLSLIPLGGLGEIGKNMMVLRYNREIIIIDAGLMFPEDELLGIDIVIPDISYLIENKEMIKGIVLTHGHEDHIGALAYVLQEINVPVYGTKLTLGLVREKLNERRITNTKLVTVRPKNKIRLGRHFRVDFFKVSHSIPDVVGLAIHTPVGLVLHTADFKFDQTPVDGGITDFASIAEYGRKGVLVLLSDSTNVERPGYTPSERAVGETFDEIFRNANSRIIIATFASNIHRIQQVIDVAYRYKRKVAIVGRSMVNVATIAQEIGYLTVPKNTLISIEEINAYPSEQIAILTTGSQGEPMSALTRMAMSDHRKVKIVPGDIVVISANPIPGNEKLVGRTINQLFYLGAEVIDESVSGIHVSGHASQEDLKLMLNLVQPKFFVPVHGEYRHLVKHANLAKQMGIPQENIFVAENGQVLEFTRQKGSIAGRVNSGRVLVDGLGVGDVGNIVLRDRKQLSQDGIFIVVVTINKEAGTVAAGPDIVSRGFVYVRESEELMEEAKNRVALVLNDCFKNKTTDWSSIKAQVRDILGKYLYERTRRRPMIMPIIMEI